MYEWIKKPTLLLNESRCRENIRFMAKKAAECGVKFRPHFKTHQSAVVGEWFREFGVEDITVSSVDMAVYFADHGWKDITIAFPVNLRQVEEVNSLAGRIRLNLLVESPAAVSHLQQNLKHDVGVWIKVDIGAHRTGIPVEDTEPIIQLARQINKPGNLKLCGLLTHAGQLYHAPSPEEIRGQYKGFYRQLNHLREKLKKNGFSDSQISYGDTPACTLVEDLSGLDEIRPGNFVFFDAMQYCLGVCPQEKIAVGLACPVVAVHPGRQTVVVYGGAIHLSKDMMDYHGNNCYGLVALPDTGGWGEVLAEAYVSGLSQEHGMIHMDGPTLQKIQVGDLLVVLPVHSCLTVDLMQRYRSLDGKAIDTLGKGYL